MFGCKNNGAQQLGFCISKAESYSATATITTEWLVEFNIIITKTDSTTEEAIEGIGFTIYDCTKCKYIDSSGNYTSTVTTIYTDANGQISISGITMSYSSHTIKVTEVSSNSDWYVCTYQIKSQSITKSQVRTGTDTLYFDDFENDPLSLEITKIDENGAYEQPDSEETDIDVLTFNSQFDGYEGEQISGDDLIKLVEAILSSNSTYAAHTITIDSSDINIYNTNYGITSSNYYDVTYGYDSDGYINSISTGDVSTNVFNSPFIDYIGETVSRQELEEIIALIQTSNDTYNNHQIKLNGKSSLNMRFNDKFDSDYTISVEYDSNGYIINIKFTKGSIDDIICTGDDLISYYTDYICNMNEQFDTVETNLTYEEDTLYITIDNETVEVSSDGIYILKVDEDYSNDTATYNTTLYLTSLIGEYVNSEISSTDVETVINTVINFNDQYDKQVTINGEILTSIPSLNESNYYIAVDYDEYKEISNITYYEATWTKIEISSEDVENEMQSVLEIINSDESDKYWTNAGYDEETEQYYIVINEVISYISEDQEYVEIYLNDGDKEYYTFLIYNYISIDSESNENSDDGTNEDSGNDDSDGNTEEEETDESDTQISEKDYFNSTYEGYNDQSISYNILKLLLEDIYNSNDSNSQHQITVNGKTLTYDTDSDTFYLSGEEIDIKEGYYYIIECEYDENYYVNNIIYSVDFEETFNSLLDYDSLTGDNITFLLELVNDYNENIEEAYQISIEYGEDLSEDSIYSNDTYEISYEYYENSSNIEKVCIEEADTYTNSIGLLGGVSFKLQYSDGTWVSGNGSSHKSYVSSSSNATSYETGEDGTVTIMGLKKGTYKIYEVSIDSSASSGYYLEDQEGYDSENNWVYCGSVTITNTTNKTSYSVTYSNLRSGNLEITKTDKDTGSYLNSVGFKLYYAYDYYGNEVGIWVTGTKNSMKTYDSSTTYSQASTYTTSGTGKVTIKNLRLGTYYIYEYINNNDGYYLEDQTSANGLTGYSYNSTTGLVKCGTVKICPANQDIDECSEGHTSHNPIKVSIKNVRRIKISGYVWIDESNSKGTYDTGGYNSVYDSPVYTSDGSVDYIGERLVYEVTVSLYEKDTDKLILTTTTDESGSYIFNDNYDDPILYGDIKARRVLHKI